jgi:hypothetical protein
MLLASQGSSNKGKRGSQVRAECVEHIGAGSSQRVAAATIGRDGRVHGREGYETVMVEAIGRIERRDVDHLKVSSPGNLLNAGILDIHRADPFGLVEGDLVYRHQSDSRIWGVAGPLERRQ